MNKYIKHLAIFGCVIVFFLANLFTLSSDFNNLLGIKIEFAVAAQTIDTTSEPGETWIRTGDLENWTFYCTNGVYYDSEGNTTPPEADEPDPPPPPPPIQGICGDTRPALTKPTRNFCASGSPRLPIGGLRTDGPWTWSCLGANGGRDSACSVPLLVPPVISADYGSCCVASSVSITWARVSGISSYKVYKNGVLVATVNNNSYMAPNALETDVFTVKSVGNGDSAFSNAVSHAPTTSCTFSCSANPSPAKISETVNWAVNASGGGVESCKYTWTGSDSLSYSISTDGTKSKAYTLPGTKNVSVLVTGGPVNTTVNCSVVVGPLTASCTGVFGTGSVSNQKKVTWTAIGGGGKTYTYKWSGDGFTSSNSTSVSKTIAYTGTTATSTKYASVVIKSGSATSTASCNTGIPVTPPSPPPGPGGPTPGTCTGTAPVATKIECPNTVKNGTAWNQVDSCPVTPGNCQFCIKDTYRESWTDCSLGDTYKHRKTNNCTGVITETPCDSVADNCTVSRSIPSGTDPVNINTNTTWVTASNAPVGIERVWTITNANGATSRATTTDNTLNRVLTTIGLQTVSVTVGSCNSLATTTVVQEGGAVREI